MLLIYYKTEMSHFFYTFWYGNGYLYVELPEVLCVCAHLHHIVHRLTNFLRFTPRSLLHLSTCQSASFFSYNSTHYVEFESYMDSVLPEGPILCSACHRFHEKVNEMCWNVGKRNKEFSILNKDSVSNPTKKEII